MKRSVLVSIVAGGAFLVFFEDAGEAPVPTKVPAVLPAVPEQRPRR